MPVFRQIGRRRRIYKNQLEMFVINRIKAHILTENNLQEFVQLTNEEIKQSKEMYQERLTAIEGQIGDVQGRLHKLYDALETGKLELDDLAPRIKDLKGRINELKGQQLNMLEHMREAKIELLARTLLSKGTLIEHKAFLRSFVKRIKVEHPRIVLDYTIPLNAQKAEPLTREVLPFVEFSSTKPSH